MNILNRLCGAQGAATRHIVAPAPRLLKDVQVGNDRNTVVWLGIDRKLHVAVNMDMVFRNQTADVIEGEFDCFAMRPNKPEIAAVKRNGAVIERYALNGAIVPNKIPFARTTAVAYKKDGTMLAAGNEFGKIVVWSLEVDGPPRAIVECQIRKEKIARIYFAGFFLIALTAGGRCYRVPFNFAVVPRVLVTAIAAPRLVAGDGKVFDWNCYAYAPHPTLALDVFGGECGILVGQHEVFGMCAVRKTGLGAYIHNLTFCPETERLVVMGQKGVQIWNVAQSAMMEKWQVSGDLAKLGRAATGIKSLECSFAAPRPGYQPYAYAVLDGRPTIFWA
jgi:hypothetical protein